MIAAAGSGERLGAGGPKAFVEVAGRPMLAWSLAAFAAAESVDAVVIAAPPGEVDRAAQLAADAGVPEAAVVAGGNARSQSVAAGLELVETGLVAVHDAARPLVTAGLIDAVAGALIAEPGAAGAIAAARVTDTIKESGDGRAVERTIDRSKLWSAQTPQVFRAAALREALAAGDPAAATDDAMLVERGGGTVLIHSSPPGNFKVTEPRDLELAGVELRSR